MNTITFNELETIAMNELKLPNNLIDYGYIRILSELMEGMHKEGKQELNVIDDTIDMLAELETKHLQYKGYITID